eukprot:TRINITY_DN10875_c0_g1_i2.p1 TRINITY_DN10875_c0_g1~~TRINITY_DN10875_c0_g1_i2.p1  ORF type:complete len:130 (+),score=31.34 TRINITY_DN10875_c0_g1_i2:165-554(+)
MATRSNDPKIAAIQNDLDQVKVVMEQNVEKALRNTEKLEDLEVRTDQLQQNAHQFKSGSTRLKRMMCCQNIKLTLLIILIIIIVLLIIIVPTAVTLSNAAKAASAGSTLLPNVALPLTMLAALLFIQNR